MAGPNAQDAGGQAGVVVIKPRRAWPPLNWHELWERRELLYFLIWRDLKVRYKQTVLGALWAVLQPLLTMVVLTVVFKSLLGLDRRLMGASYPYPVFLYAALLPWQFFAGALKRSTESVVGSAQLMQKVYFPRLAIPLASVGSVLADFALGLLVLVGLMLYYGVTPGLRIAGVLPAALLTLCAAAGAGALLSALNAAYRDFRYVVPFLTQVWFYATPIIWALGKVGCRWRLVLALNPMCGAVEASRWAILPGWQLDVAVLMVSAASALWLLVAGLRFFTHMEDMFADIL